MQQIVNVHEAKTNLSKLIAEVGKGSEVVIGKNGKPVAKLVSYSPQKVKRIPGRLKGKIKVPDNFNDEDPEINALFYGKD